VDAVGSLDETRDFDVYRLTADWSYRLPNEAILRVGTDYQHQKGDFVASLHSIYGPLGNPVQSSPGIDRDFAATRKGDMFAVYASALTRINGTWEVEFGLRYDIQDIDPVHDNQLSPRLQINYTPSASTAVFLNLGRYVQHQNLYELQLDDGLVELTDPEQSDQASIGLRVTPKTNVQVQIEVYYKKISDPQPRFDNLYNRYVLLPELHADRVTGLASKARARGVELSAGGAWRDGVFWRASYVLADVEEKFGGSWRPRAWDQHHSLKLGLDWQGRNWRVALQGTYHTGWATTSLITEPTSSVAQYNDTRLQDFASIDLSIARQWQFSSSVLEFYLDVSNLSNRTNIGGHDYRLDAGLIWQRDAQALLPILPVLGVKWQW
jgi:outer membrane receptor protein involved in Fe transport